MLKYTLDILMLNTHTHILIGNLSESNEITGEDEATGIKLLETFVFCDIKHCRDFLKSRAIVWLYHFNFKPI